MSLILSGTDGLSDVDGTAATPAIRGTDANTGIFFPAADTIAFSEGGVEAMRLDSSGNLLIGVTDTNIPASANSFNFNKSDNTLRFTNTTAAGKLWSIGTSSPGVSAQGDYFSFTHYDGSSLSEFMRLDASGNLGVGTTSPSNFGNANNRGLTVNGQGTAGFLELQSSGTAYGAVYANSINAGIRSITALPLTFETNATERARIDSSGNLLVGVTTFGTAAGPRLYVDNTNNVSGDNAIFAQLGSNCSNTSSAAFSALITGVGNKFYVYGNGNVVNTSNSYGAISDIKFKENIADATPKLNDVMRLKVRNFNLKTEPDNKQIGFIAQEFEQVFPSMIDVSPDTDVNGQTLETTHKSIKMSVLVPILVKCVQEQQALITQLTARITALESA